MLAQNAQYNILIMLNEVLHRAASRYRIGPEQSLRGSVTYQINQIQIATFHPQPTRLTKAKVPIFHPLYKIVKPFQLF